MKLRFSLLFVIDKKVVNLTEINFHKKYMFGLPEIKTSKLSKSSIHYLKIQQTDSTLMSKLGLVGTLS